MWKPVCLLFTSFIVSAFAGDSISLVRVGEPWRYLPATSELTTPSTLWTQLGFNDSAWREGRSGFAFVAEEATVLERSALAFFFRKTFNVSDVSEIKWLLLRIDYDDGFVAYLNGQEIARRGLAGQPVAYNEPASPGRPRGLAEEIDVSAFIGALHPGPNVLAVQVHNFSQFDFSFGFIPELLANFQRGPLVQNVTSNSIQIIWRTPVLADTQIEFGPTGFPGNALTNSFPTNEHVVTLTNLNPGTDYYYRVGSSAEGKRALSPVSHFRTSPLSGDLSFVLFGDSGYGSMAQFQVADVVRTAAPDFVLHAGDLIYGFFTAGRADTRCLSVYGEHMRSTPYFFTIGNHDLYSHPTLGDLDYLATFYLPTNSATGTEHYYSFDYGDAHFVSLFAPLFNQLPQYILQDPGTQFPEGSPQYRWLTNDLAKSAKPWKFLFFHIPIRTSSIHRYDNSDLNGFYDSVDLQRILLPVVKKYGVQMVFNGHDHDFERFAPTNGLHSVVSGGGGVYLYPMAERDEASAQFWMRHHCAKVTIRGDSLSLEAIDTTGQVFDRMFIQRALPPAQLYQSTWHSPVVENLPANDFDGNISGQTFDFVGTPIPTLPGDFSNLGRVYVNNDRTNLYLGFEQAMFYPDNTVYFFIESPRKTGVRWLAGLGNGVIDPDDEGADGLDILENLGFTNFTPAVAAILGDEFGDSHSRSFSRVALSLNTGQGVFNLDTNFSDVSGARLQQFNRSPQQGVIAEDENADFMEIAIPLSALGGLREGDIIKIAAVVGGNSFQTNALQQQRLLDRSFLGATLLTNNPAMTLLDGVRVQLALDPDPDSDGLTSAEESLLGTNPVNADSDEDGLKDGWEVQHGLNPLSAASFHGGGADPDNDGMTNLEEQAAGTNPFDATSVLRIALTLLPPGDIHLTWPTIVGKSYSLEAATPWPTNFMTISGGSFPRVATGTNMSFDEPMSSSPKFYRLRLLP